MKLCESYITCIKGKQLTDHFDRNRSFETSWSTGHLNATQRAMRVNEEHAHSVETHETVFCFFLVFFLHKPEVQSAFKEGFLKCLHMAKFSSQKSTRGWT